MKMLGYTLLSLVAVVWVVAMVAGMIAAFPYGLIGLVAIVGVGCLLVHIIVERLRNKEDSYYEKNVDQ